MIHPTLWSHTFQNQMCVLSGLVVFLASLDLYWVMNCSDLIWSIKKRKKKKKVHMCATVTSSGNKDNSGCMEDKTFCTTFHILCSIGQDFMGSLRFVHSCWNQSEILKISQLFIFYIALIFWLILLGVTGIKIAAIFDRLLLK